MTPNWQIKLTCDFSTTASCTADISVRITTHTHKHTPLNIKKKGKGEMAAITLANRLTRGVCNKYGGAVFKLATTSDQGTRRSGWHWRPQQSSSDAYTRAVSSSRLPSGNPCHVHMAKTKWQYMTLLPWVYVPYVQLKRYKDKYQSGEGDAETPRIHIINQAADLHVGWGTRQEPIVQHLQPPPRTNAKTQWANLHW